MPPASLQHPSRYEEAEQAWVWEYPVDDGEKHDLYMDIGEIIKFRVTEEIFEDNSPVGPPTNDKQSATTAPSTSIEIKTPYKILGAINESGLGLLSWWDSHNKPEESEENGEYETAELMDV